MNFGEPKFKTSVSNDNEDKKYSEDEIKTMTRRSFLKGATLAGTAGAISHVEKKGEKITKAINFLKNTFARKTKEQSNKNIELKNIADYYLKAFEELKMKEEFFPKEIFTRDLLIAQQLQESNYKANAKSHAGAVGTMQNMDISIKDVSQFLEKLDRNTDFEYTGPIYLNPKLEQEKKDKKKEKFGNRILKDSDFISLELLRVDNPDYSKALGKLYLMRLYNQDYGYGAGYDKYQKGDIKGAQAEILGAYNAGYSRIKNKPIDKWLQEPRTYVQRIFNYMERLKNIRQIMSEVGLDKNNDSIAMRTAREMNKVRVTGSKRKNALEKTAHFIIETIKKAENDKGSELTNDEIINIFSKFSKTKDITTELFYAQI